MGVLIEIGQEEEWHLVLNEQFNIPNGSKKPHKVMDYLMDKGIIFGVTYSDYGLHIHLQNVEYIDDDYDNFLKVATDILLFKKQFSKLVIPEERTDEEKITSIIGKPSPVPRAIVESVTEPESAESLPVQQPAAPVEEPMSKFVDNSALKQPPQQ